MCKSHIGVSSGVWAKGTSECDASGSCLLATLLRQVTSASRVNSRPGIGKEDSSGYGIMFKQRSGLLQVVQWSVCLGEKLVWVSIDSFLFSDTGWKLGGWQSILESPLEVIKSIVQPKKRGSLVEPGRHGPFPMLCCPIICKEWHSGTFSLHLCGAWFSPGVSSFTIPEQKEDNFFLILLHCPCCSSKEHKRPPPTITKNVGSWKDSKMPQWLVTPLPLALGVRELKKKSKHWSSRAFVSQRRQIINPRMT